MNKTLRYLWLVPALYVAFMFCIKIVEGFAHSPEFVAIIGVVPFLQPYAQTLAPVVGVLDFCIGVALILNLLVTKSAGIQRFLFCWTILWPFVPASLRYFGGVGSFEIVEVLSISIASLVAWMLWEKYARRALSRR